MSGILPTNFDRWLTNVPEGPEAPCKIALQRDYECKTCACPFSPQDTFENNFSLEWEEGRWLAWHKQCPPD